MSTFALTAGEQPTVALLQAWFAQEAAGIRQALDADTALSEHRIGGLRILRACVQAYEVLRAKLAAIGLVPTPAVADDPSVGRDPLLRNHMLPVVELANGRFVLDVVTGKVTPVAQAGLLPEAQQAALLANDMAALKAVPDGNYVAKRNLLARRLGLAMSPALRGPVQPLAGFVAG